MRCYWVDGVDAISMNEICRRTGVSKPVMYREFGNEDGLMRAALSHYYTRILLQIHQIFQGERSFGDTLDVLIDVSLEASAALGYPTGCLFVGMSNSTKRMGTETNDEIARTQAKILRTYQDWFERSKTRGEFMLDITTEFAAKYLHAQLSSAMNQQARGESAETAKQVLRMALSVFR